jgi:hypothetical protein
MKRIASLTIGAIAIADVVFSMVHRATMIQWESNPVASYCLLHWGVFGVIALRLLTTLFVLAVMRGKHRGVRLLTIEALGANGLVAVQILRCLV